MCMYVCICILFIIFKDRAGKEFIYMPKWSEIKTILNGKDTVEKVNKQLCFENNNPMV